MERNPPWPVAYLAAALVSSAVLAADAEVEVPVRSLLVDNSVVAIRAGEVLGSVQLPKGTLATKLEALSGGWITGAMRETPLGTELYLLVRRGSESRELDIPIAEGSLLRGWATPMVRDPHQGTR